MDLEREEEESEKGAKNGKKRNTLGKEAVAVMKDWMFSPEHFYHPYPSEAEKQQLADAAGITQKQLSNWFTNARKRLWQPMMRQRQTDTGQIQQKRMRNVLEGDPLEKMQSPVKRPFAFGKKNSSYDRDIHQTKSRPHIALQNIIADQLQNSCDTAELHAVCSALLGLANF
jgi:hypothetical protein